MTNINKNLIHNYAVNIKFHSILAKLIHFSKVNEKMFIDKIIYALSATSSVNGLCLI